MDGRKFLYPEFADSPVPVKIAAGVLGVSEKTLREKMEQQVFDIGIIYRKERSRGHVGSRNCYISPKKLWELTGFVWTEEKACRERKK